VYGYKFLVDNDCRGVVSLLPSGRALNLKDVGLSESSSDEEIIEEAVSRRYIIMTANGQDFVDKVNRFVASSTRKEWGCHDASGLVVVPNDHASQERLIPWAEERLRLHKRQITWPDVWSESLLVRIKKDENHEVRQLPRCPTCVENLARR
jgi:hypothetical protein